MKKFIAFLCLTLPIISNAGNIPKAFDSRPVFPTVEIMRNVEWTWQNFSKLPKMGKLEKDSQFKGLYRMSQTINEEKPQTIITFYGTQAKPEVAVIEARTWGAADTQDTNFVRLDMLKGNIPLESNCNFKNLSTKESGKEKDGYSWESGANLAFQQAYILPRNISSLSNKTVAKNDLYVVSSQVESYVVTGSFQTQAYTQSIITPNKNKLSQYISKFGWNTNKQEKKVNCKLN